MAQAGARSDDRAYRLTCDRVVAIRDGLQADFCL
jgi:hypothetical protein